MSGACNMIKQLTNYTLQLVKVHDFKLFQSFFERLTIKEEWNNIH